MIYFLDGNQEVIKIVRSSAVISAIQTQELPEDNSLLRDYLNVRLKNDERLFNAQYMAIKSYGGNRNAFDLYRIASEIVPDNATEFMGVQVAPYELEGVVIEDLRPTNRPLNQTMNQVLTDSDWRLGYVADNLPAITTTFYYVSAKDALKSIQELASVEMIFKVEISGNKITDKWVEVYHQLGNRTMKRFNYGTNALSVVRESSHDELYTALIGRGKGEEVGETESGDATYGRKINFAEVEWKKSAGKPVDKPKGQKYIELPNATAEYGIKLLDGRKVPRIGIVEFSDTDDPEILIQETYQELLVRARPKVLFKASVINTGDMLIGDTVTIHRHDLDFHYQARVRKVVRDRKNNNKTQVEIGDVVHTPSTKRQGQINSALNNVASDLENVRGEITEARQSADGKNTNFYGNVEPDRKKVGDTWFRDHPSLTGESQILVWDGEAWELIMDTSDTTKNADAIEEQQKEIEEAKQTADEALSEIDVAIRNAGFTSLDDTIKSVQSRANTAFDTANDLIGEVSGYSQTVDGFNQTVNNYTNQVSNFRSDVDGFSSTVASYSADVRGYVTQVSTLTNEVSGFNSTVANVDGRVTSLSTTVDGISSTVSGLGGRLSTVEQTASGLQSIVASKASQSQVTQLSNAYNIFVGGIESRKNLLPSVEHGAISSISGDEYSVSGYIRSPYIPVEPSSFYIASLDGSPVSFAIYNYSDIGQFIGNSSQNTSGKFIGSNVKYIRVVINNSDPDLKYQLEMGYLVTDYVPFIGDVSSAQLSVLQNNINLRVTKGELLSQINIEAGRTLIQSDKILLNATNTVITGTTWMDGAVLKNLSVDGAKIKDASIASAKIANLDASKITTGVLEGITLRGVTGEFTGSITAERGYIGSWNIRGGALSAPNDNGTYSMFKSNGSMLSAQVPRDDENTQGSTLQIFVTGEIRTNKNNQMRISQYQDTLSFYANDSTLRGVLSGEYNSFDIQTSGVAIRLMSGTVIDGFLRPNGDAASHFRIGDTTNRWYRIYTQQGAYVSSDVRYKDNIRQIPYGLLKEFERLEPKAYEMDGKTHIGYIAQDVERALYKYALKEVGFDKAREHMEQFDMLIKDESYMGLVYSEMAVLKDYEHQVRIKELENRIKELENAS